MMTREQWLLGKIAEEAAEVAQRALKAQQFGLSEIQAGQDQSNLDRLAGELKDLSISVRLLDPKIGRPDSEYVGRRYERMEKYLLLAQKLGQVEEGVQL